MATHENYREAVAGRSNVEDTPELLAYYEWECRRSRAKPSVKIVALLKKAGFEAQ